MSRSSRLGVDGSIVFPSIIADSRDDRKTVALTPVPPSSKAKKKHVPVCDHRVQLEPLKPSLVVSSPMVELVPVSTPPMTASSENMASNVTLESQVSFYRQLASLRLRNVVGSEKLLFKTIDALLVSTVEALDADWAVLYALNEQTKTLNVTSCTVTGITEFHITLDQFAMAEVVHHVPKHVETGDEPTPVTAPLYVENLQSLSSYVHEYDIDSVVDGMNTCSTLASVIVNEQGRPIFVVEVRSQQVKPLSRSIFATAVTTLENVVYQYDLHKAWNKTNTAYEVLNEILQHTVHPESSDPPTEVKEDSKEDMSMVHHEKQVCMEALTVVQQQRQCLISPNLQQLIQCVLRQSQSDAVCLLEFYPNQKHCSVLAHGYFQDKERSSAVYELSSEQLHVFRHLGDQEGEASLFQRLVTSVECAQPVDLTEDPELASLRTTLEAETAVFIPLPRSFDSSYTGLVCLYRTRHYDHNHLLTLHPFLTSLSLAIIVKQQRQDMIASTSQMKKLINLFNSRSQAENINDPSSLVNLICAIGEDIFNTTRVTLYVADPIKSELWSLSTLGSANGIRIPYGTGIAGTVACSKETMIVYNPYEDPRFDRSFDEKFGFKTESLITFAILDRTGETLGVIQAVNPQEFMDPSAHRLIQMFDTKVLDVYSDLVSHALQINSSLIMFAKVQADYWANNRVVVDEQNQVQQDVASVHSLLDISGFDSAKRVPRNKWSTFAYACLALGKFLARRWWYRKRVSQQAERKVSTKRKISSFRPIQEDKRENGGTNEMERSSDIVDPHLKEVEHEEDDEDEEEQSVMEVDMEAIRRVASVTLRTHRTSLLDRRSAALGAKLAVEHDELLSDTFDSLTKSISELKNYAFQLFTGLLLTSTFRIDPNKLRSFISALADKYRIVPYHSFYHGFDVAQGSYRMIRETGIIHVIKEYEALSLVIAALGHDADHPGNDNQFEIDSGSSLALQYNDISVLENHHAATTFAVLRTPECDILDDVSPSMRVSIRTAIIRCILATDMKHHSKMLGELAVLNHVNDFETVTDGRQIMLNMVIHSADLGNVTRPLEIARKWVDLVCEEFTQQAKKSEQLGIVVPPHILNLQDDGVKSRLQVNFIDYLVAPLWNSIATILPETKKQVERLRANREFFFENASQMTARRAVATTHQ